MSAGQWDDEDDGSWHMHASAEDEGRVYQAGRDQHITEYHFHSAAPEIDDEDADDDWYFEDEIGSSWDGFWETLLSVLLALAPLLPLAIAGASIHSVWTAKSHPSAWWSALYSLGAFIVGAVGLTILREWLSHRTGLIDTLSWGYVPVSIGAFIYYMMGDPAKLDIKFIGAIGLELARKLGPL
jgi:hypothetical protein